MAHQGLVDRLVVELGRAVAAVYAADREAPESEDLAAAHASMAEATGLIVELASGIDVDADALQRAWHAIALAHDAALRASEAVARSRSQLVRAAALRRELKAQTERASRQAARLGRAWRKRMRSREAE